jgi:hypothetical protein
VASSGISAELLPYISLQQISGQPGSLSESYRVDRDGDMNVVVIYAGFTGLSPREISAELSVRCELITDAGKRSEAGIIRSLRALIQFESEGVYSEIRHLSPV